MTRDIDELEEFFAAARQTAQPVSDGLMARVLQDAADMRPKPAPLPRRAGFAEPGLWRRVCAAFGGAGILAGMATAALAGIYLGFAQPVGEGVLVSLQGAESDAIDMMPSIEALFAEDAE